VSLAEIAPTILRAAGVTPPAEMKGRDLMTIRLKADTTITKVDATDANAGDSGRVRLQPDLYSETEYPRVAGWSPLQALTDGRWKIIRAGATTEVFDLQSDPREDHDVAATQPAVAAAMRARADTIHGSAGARPARAISADAQERLRALGYVAGAMRPAPPSGAPNPARAIAAWNAFEDALSALSARQTAAVDALKKLAAANPDAAVMQTTYARALKDAGGRWQRSPSIERRRGDAGRCDAAPRSRRRRS